MGKGILKSNPQPPQANVPWSQSSSRTAASQRVIQVGEIALPPLVPTCLRCGYCLDGVDLAGVCPECGGPATQPPDQRLELLACFQAPHRAAWVALWLGSFHVFAAIVIGTVFTLEWLGLRPVRPAYDTWSAWWQDAIAATCLATLLACRITWLMWLVAMLPLAASWSWRGSLLLSLFRTAGLAACVLFFVASAINGSSNMNHWFLIVSFLVAAVSSTAGWFVDLQLQERATAALGGYAPPVAMVMARSAVGLSMIIWAGLLVFVVGIFYTVYLLPAALLAHAVAHVSLAVALNTATRKPV